MNLGLNAYLHSPSQIITSKIIFKIKQTTNCLQMYQSYFLETPQIHFEPNILIENHRNPNSAV